MSRADVADICKLLVAAGRDTAIAASQIAELFWEMSETRRLTPVPADLIDGLADALHSVLLVELDCIDDDMRLLAGPSEMSGNARAILTARREFTGQLAGALTRYLERGL